MAKTMAVAMLVGASVLFGTARTVLAQADPFIPQAVQNALTSAKIPPAEHLKYYTAMISAMLRTNALQNLKRFAANPATRERAVRLVLRLGKAFRGKVVSNLASLQTRCAALKGTRYYRSLLELVGKRGSWSHVVRKGARVVGRKGAIAAKPLLLVTTAVVAGTMGYLAGKAYLKHEDLRARAAEDAAVRNLCQMLVTSMRAGRAKLLKGVSLEKAIERMEKNLDAGLPPFANVIELKPCPDISGAWEGLLVVKKISGQTNIRVGQRRMIRGKRFVIEQDHNYVTLRFAGQRISGCFQPQQEQLIPSGVKRSIMVVDIAVLDENPGGTLAWVRLAYHSGAGAGGLKGKLTVTMEQRPAAGTVIASGGMLTKRR